MPRIFRRTQEVSAGKQKGKVFGAPIEVVCAREEQEIPNFATEVLEYLGERGESRLCPSETF